MTPPAFYISPVPFATRITPRACSSIPEGASLVPTFSLSDRLSRLAFGYESSVKEATIRYRCRNGHLVTVMRGTSACAKCPTCAFSHCGRSTRRLCISQLAPIAREHGGELVSTVYVNARKPLLWRCALGHVWAATADNIRRRRSWCPKCAHRSSIERMHELAAKRGGQCLSDSYIGAREKLRWRCKRGHEFEKAPNNAFRKPGGKRKSSWCAICAKIDKQPAAVAIARPLPSACSRSSEKELESAPSHSLQVAQIRQS